MDQNVVKMFAHTIYSEEMLRVLVYPTVSKTAAERAKECMNIVNAVPYNKLKSLKDPFRVQVVVNTVRKNPHFAVQGVNGENFVAHIPVQYAKEEDIQVIGSAK
jgi:hypothetical protein